MKLTDVFTKKNGKLGKIINFSIPPVNTCPGATETCISKCYARKKRYHSKKVKNKLQSNFKLTQKHDFHSIAINALQNVANNSKVRIHAAGDFYNPAYVKKWIKIIKHYPQIQFWCYTRSWRIPKIMKELTKLAKLPNIQIWFSCDKDTGKPTIIPNNVRLAYLMLENDDTPDYETDLLFRDYKIRNTILKHKKGTLICPAENGISKTTCEQCQICSLSPIEKPNKRTKNRFPLPMVA